MANTSHVALFLAVCLILSVSVTFAYIDGRNAASVSTVNGSTTTIFHIVTNSTSSSSSAVPKQTITLSSPRSERNGQFGYSVALGGDYAVVGACNENDSASNPVGNAYVFNTSNGDLVSTLSSSNPTTNGLFGLSVATNGRVAVAGAPDEAAGGYDGGGHVYVFNATTGVRIFALTSPNVQPDGFFGWSVAMSNNILVIGATGEVNGQLDGAGRVYVFNNTSGSLVTTLTSPSPQNDASFGYSVAISGNTVAVGAPHEAVNGNASAGSTFIFNAISGGLLASFNNPNADVDGVFGDSVATNGASVVVGAPGEGPGIVGHAYTFDLATGKLIAELAKPDSQIKGLFGRSVGIDSNGLVLVGSSGENVSSYSSAGRVDAFTTNGTLVSSIYNPNLQAGAEFGVSIAMNDNLEIVGAFGQNGYAGNAYLLNTQ